MRAALIAVVFIGIAATGFWRGDSKEKPEKAIQHTLIVQTDSLAMLIRKMQKTAANHNADEKQLRQQFLQLRLAYKKIEWAAEYFAPNITRFVNGPPVVEVELSGQLFNPDGLQIIEGLLFPRFSRSHQQSLNGRLAQLLENIGKYKSYFERIELYNWQIVDAAKLEAFRVLTLGITGFDNPLLLNSMQESAIAIASLQPVLACYTTGGNQYGLQGNIRSAVVYLRQSSNFNTFNRAVFITRYGNPLSISINTLQHRGNFPVVKYNRLLNQDAATLFDKNAFNVNAYTDGPEYFTSAQKVALGKKLFADPVLSGASNRSCASCHKPELAFTDGLPKNRDITGLNMLSRNTPTLINAALAPAQFYDLRVNTLEDQAIDVVQNKNEMHGDMRLSTKKLWNDVTYRALFSNAFPKQNRVAIDTGEVMNAIGSYIRSLTLLNSRFDQYMQGDPTALTKGELEGFNLFMGKARCATCHYMPLFNGALPPKFLKIDAEVIGVPATKNGKKIDPDPGRYDIVPIDAYRHAFKTTTVRNAAKTAPYMHNGIFNTLDEVIDFYDKGGGAGRGISIRNQTLSADRLHLTDLEKKELIAFIKSLDSR